MVLSGRANDLALKMADAKAIEANKKYATAFNDVVQAIIQIDGIPKNVKDSFSAAGKVIDNIGSIASDLANAKVVDQFLYAQNLNNREATFMINGKEEQIANYAMKAGETYQNIVNALPNN